MQIHEIPHGINVVIETHAHRVYIGRFDSTNGFTALLHDCDVMDFPGEAESETYIRETAKYGVDVVCANLLQNYKREVTLVVRRGTAPLTVPSVAGDEVSDVHTEGIDCMTISLDGEDIEEPLIAELVKRHDKHATSGI